MSTPGASKESFEDAIDGEPGTAVDERVVGVNKRTVAVAVGVLVVVVAAILMWGSSDPVPAEEQAQSAPVRSVATPTATMRLPVTYGDADPRDFGPLSYASLVSETTGATAATATGASAAAPESVASATPVTSEAAPQGAGMPSGPTAAEVADLMAKVEAIQRASEEASATAYRSSVFFAPPLPAAAGSAGTDLFGPGLAPGAGSLGGIETPVSPLVAERTPTVDTNLQLEKRAFTEEGGGGVRPVLPERLRQPSSPYTLQAGSTVAASLLTAINTDLPGRIVAQVTSPVYDSVTGQHLLIPQGARLLGSYDSLVSNGQDRALLVWERLLFPDGSSLILDALLGTDPTGAAGVKDKVDYHLDRLLGGVLLSTAITYGANSARDRDSGRDEDLIGDSVALESTRVGGRIVDRVLDVQPTIKIRQGARVRVLVEEDLLLEPYRY
ncbi:TrbI/VirB10 family protein [Phycisphaera mikurensis]|uniref:Conjugal transfer protein TrbI n=1 Tax=Phycisphaera mikurensis (strain NBRC 102666 / KCTC 22515 / FYK2301M01) TaxID=1142394 RepID=I0IJI5_PHYMF|nr:TrbI/VirB10 family protein [Phycisphaera mikurensis]MBB6443173.1 type IV secretion system protein VirB10 [Phycisphaera mikurensis]BAM05423.1 conjugal transfer protein TrbI [Phycisphaera mikurensis NBRC 102666]